MKTSGKNLVDAQQEAIDAICALRVMTKPDRYSRTKRLSRSMRPIWRKYRSYAVAQGFSSAQIYQQMHDIIDMVVLYDNADE